MLLARTLAVTLARAEYYDRTLGAPCLTSVMVWRNAGRAAPDFRLAPFCRGGHRDCGAAAPWTPPLPEATLRALCVAPEEVAGGAVADPSAVLVWRLAAVVAASAGLDAFAHWDVTDVFRKILAREHPDVTATALPAGAKLLLQARRPLACSAPAHLRAHSHRCMHAGVPVSGSAGPPARRAGAAAASAHA
jgi:hypothetical protein